MSIEELRLRLANLGVDVRPPKRVRGADAMVGDTNAQISEARPEGSPDRRRTKLQHSASESEIDDVMEVYDRRREERFVQGPKFLQPVKQLDVPPKWAVRPEHAPTVFRKEHSIHSPLGSVLAQYREAEMRWSTEKAALRREAKTQRQRAHQLDLKNRKLLASNKHRAMDIASLKDALRRRDKQLQSFQDKISRVEAALAESQEATEQRSADVVFERDELRRLLAATMRRLENVDSYINDTLANTNALEERFEAIQQQRQTALEAASKSSALKKELDATRKKLSLQQGVIRRVADIQLKKNRRQKEAIKDILQFTSEATEAQDRIEDEERDVLPTLESILGRTE